jgi:hypothetical protein
MAWDGTPVIFTIRPRFEAEHADPHSCIEAAGVLAVAQSSKTGSTGPVENDDKPGIRGLPRGFWEVGETSASGPID